MGLPARMPWVLATWVHLPGLLGPLLRAGSRADGPEGSFQDEDAVAPAKCGPSLTMWPQAVSFGASVSLPNQREERHSGLSSKDGCEG